MIIPSAKIERLPYPLHGMTSLQQMRYTWEHPPLYRLLEDFVVTLDDGLELVHPAGFVVDGASVPRLLWCVIEPTGPLLEGAILHDFFYQHGYLLARRRRGDIYNLATEAMLRRYPQAFGKLIPVFLGRGQRFGDRLLKGITAEKHGATVEAEKAYQALQLFGRFAWGKYRELGPGAFNTNSLALPGANELGVAL